MQDSPSTSTGAIAQEIDVPTITSDQTPWFPVSVTKLLVMSICTLSLYHVYWLYQNWTRVQRRENTDIIPAARAIFGIFFCYQLFVKIRDFDLRATQFNLQAGALATGWILASLLWRLPDPYWWIAISSTVFLLPVQAKANACNATIDPKHDTNSKFTTLNWIGIVPGGMLLILAAIGTAASK